MLGDWERDGIYEAGTRQQAYYLWKGRKEEEQQQYNSVNV